jgi:succinate dehydrogenase / fumarate reductase, membrane anchor subunit
MVNTQTNRHGHSLWLIQRFSAVVMVVYSLTVILIYLNTPIHTYTDWKAFFNSTLFGMAWLKILTLLFLLSLFLHAWIGVSDVISDYISNLKLRFTLQKMMELALCGYTCWSIWVLWNA